MTKHPIILCFALCLIAGLVFTWPLAVNFFSAIPYTLRPIPGFERVPLMPGDHLQTYYWFWLLSDNLFGHSALFTNPYEFNGLLGPMSTVYANFPFSILFILLLPLGPVGAYNGLILLSFLFCGLSMFLLARSWTKDYWASMMAGLIFAVIPFRVSHISGGQLPGYVIFLLPLCLYFIERTLTTGRWIYGGAGGVCLVLLSLMDPHTSYLAALTIGVYLPSRILFNRSLPLIPGEEISSLWPGLFGAFIGGLSISFFLWIRFRITDGYPLLSDSPIQPFLLGMIATLVLWFYLSAILARLTTLSYSEARKRLGMAFLFFVPLWFYLLKFVVNIPHLGLILMVMCSTFFSAFLIYQWLQQRDRLLFFDHRRSIPAIVGTGLGLALATAYLMHIRTTVFLPSLAGKGRAISEVLLFSPRVSNLFFWQDINQERFILLGWGLLFLAAFGLFLLLKSRHRDSELLALAGVLAFFGVVLTLGPRLITFPLYQFLYRFFPFFNYSRVPSRFVFVGVIFLCLLAAMALSAIREGLTARGWIRLRNWLPILIIPLVLAEYHTWQPLGFSLMDKGKRTYEQIEKMSTEGERVLELPIWPGDSHQSSAYEYTVTRTRKPMINGYAPVVHRNYIQQVFWPLFPLDFGELGEKQAAVIKNLKVGLITFHDDSQLYPEKVSPFPPRLALKRLLASPFLKLVDRDQDVSLFKFNSDFSAAPSDHKNPPMIKGERGGFKEVSNITSPVSAVYHANYLSQETGKKETIPLASGYYLMMDEKALVQGKPILSPGGGGNVVSASPGEDRAGYLVVSPHRFFPSGKYSARFRIQTGSAGIREEVGRIEIIKDRKTVLKQKVLLGKDVSPFLSWIEIPMEFETPNLAEIGFRFFYSGKTLVRFNSAVISFADQKTGPGSVEAEDLFRQTGQVIADPMASGQEAVFAKAGYHPPIYLSYGPYQTFSPGQYQADFFLRLNKSATVTKETEVVLIEVATDMGKRIFGQRRIKAQELRSDHYEPIRLEFNIPFSCELGFRVKFLNQADVLVDKMEVSLLGAKQDRR